MTKNQQLSELLIELGKASGLAVTRSQALEMGFTHFLFIEYAAAYGGYRLVNVNAQNGGHSQAFNRSDTSARLKFSEMTLYIASLIAGIEYSLQHESEIKSN